MTTIELSHLTAVQMATYITKIYLVRWQQHAFVNNTIQLIESRILTGDLFYWNEVLKSL
jgi:hypothetical protein